MNIFLKSLLKDKNVLYVVLFISITNIFVYLMLKNFDAIIFFFLVGFLSTYFSKNMIIVMIISIISTNILMGSKLLGSYREGMEVNSESSVKNVKQKIKNKNKNKKVIDNMTTLSPTNIDESDDEGELDNIPGPKPKINYASTLESAYDNLDKLLSSDSINKMTTDTQRLAEKQQVLMGNIEKLVPFIGKAENLLKGMNSDKMGGMLEKMQEQMTNISKNIK
jgi:hypothetical protein